MFKHESIETNSGLLIVLSLVAMGIGGLVEIVPLHYINDTIEKVDGVRPYTPLELRGRDIYQREGCYLCHSQMIRPFRDEALRYGHYSLAAESQYDHPFQWGSKRTGPDLARVGGKYSNEWHVQHLTGPRTVVPESIMPNYPWLIKSDLQYADVGDRMRALKKVGVPYSLTKEEFDANVKKFGEEVAMDLDINRAEENLVAEAQKENFDGNPSKLSEMDALVAYLQMLGTLVDFKKYDEGYFVEFR
ncbi:MAG TPA: cytochrome-c oxidase, cbb3-type subunit II [Gammaproteobacteria bacterium]|nr:cytochrome-c oxidase, cbb3-type subunit II [Gammaproteobacteria bacterium]